jgi:hypothetical protein
MRNTIISQYILRHSALAMWLVVVPLIFFGCAATARQAEQQPVMSPEESLRATAGQYWKVRMEKRYEDSYKMEEKTELPPFDRYQNQLLAMMKIQILKHEIKEVRVDNTNGTVTVEFYMMLPPAPMPFSQSIDDHWINRDGVWLHLLPRS